MKKNATQDESTSEPESASEQESHSQTETSDRIPQIPQPNEGNPPRTERDPSHPTATAPHSVAESVYEEAEWAGRSGPNAADPPKAEGKHDSSDSHDSGAEHHSARTERRRDVAEKPGSTAVSHEHADELADEWGEESFPGSDPPAHY